MVNGLPVHVWIAVFVAVFVATSFSQHATETKPSSAGFTKLLRDYDVFLWGVASVAVFYVLFLR